MDIKRIADQWANWRPGRHESSSDFGRNTAKPAEPVLDDAMDGDHKDAVVRQAMREQIAVQEKARRTAVERASSAEPSIDDEERAKLDGLRARLAEAKSAAEGTAGWKKFLARFVSGTDVEKSREQISLLEKQVKDQEYLLRDLAGVASYDGLVRAMHDRQDDGLLALPLGEPKQSFAEIFRMLGNKEMTGRIDARLSVTNADPEFVSRTDDVRKFLENRAGGGSPVDRKWAMEGLRLLAECDGAAKRYRAYLRSIPRKRTEDRGERVVPGIFFGTDSQGEEISAK